MRICIIGNSPAECLKVAWQSKKSITAKHSASFFPANAKGIGLAAQPESGRIFTGAAIVGADQAIGVGPSHIVVDDFDVFVLVGFCKKIGGLIEAFSSPGYSSAVRLATVQDYWARRKLPRLTEEVRGITDAPIFLMHTPLPASTEPGSVPVSAYGEMIRASQAEIFDKYSAVLVPQAEHTLNGGMATHERFSAKSSGSGKSDITRMSVEFGSIMLDELAGAIDQIKVARLRPTA